MVTDTQSGSVTADVELNAAFGANPMLGGTIDNFRAAEGSNPGAVDDRWEVTLETSTVTSGAAAGTAADASGDGQDGTWSATSYAPSDSVRPTGIFGGFNAHFSNGHAAGAYATRPAED